VSSPPAVEKKMEAVAGMFLEAVQAVKAAVCQVVAVAMVATVSAVGQELKQAAQ